MLTDLVDLLMTLLFAAFVIALVVSFVAAVLAGTTLVAVEVLGWMVGMVSQ